MGAHAVAAAKRPGLFRLRHIVADGVPPREAFGFHTLFEVWTTGADYHSTRSSVKTSLFGDLAVHTPDVHAVSEQPRRERTENNENEPAACAFTQVI
ncbi:hypothetical protein [Actinomadura decatromicini]|uniref:Uncharacterized protein n=1 Tax=Actinomadura decatromicini TaxID=2604572 RepID=A0A5D3FW43_9ACTN|nr:hypothetical protein [Actinomadura decatromicini]TYK52541.1 hypothetical protein FXF68_01845 [Actinomadura decatromicini]